MAIGEQRKKPIYPFPVPMKLRTETGLLLANRQPSSEALVALWDADYGFALHYYERVTLFCREKAMAIRDKYISAACEKPEALYLGDLQIVDGHAELRFEAKPYGWVPLLELLFRTFGCYSPLKAHAAHIYESNPVVYCGEQSLGTLKEIVAENLRSTGEVGVIQ